MRLALRWLAVLTASLGALFLTWWLVEHVFHGARDACQTIASLVAGFIPAAFAPWVTRKDVRAPRATRKEKAEGPAAGRGNLDTAGCDSGNVTILRWGVISAGVMALIASFLPWYSVSVSVLDITRSAGVNAWHGGLYAWFPVLLLVVAGGLVLVSTVAELLRRASRPLITLGLSAPAFVTILLRWVTFPDASGRLGEPYDLNPGTFTAVSGAGSGLYLGLIAAMVAVVASSLMFRTARRTPVTQL